MADIRVRITAVDEVSVPMKKAGDEVEKTGKKAKEASSAFEGLGKEMLKVAAGLGLQVTLESVLGGLKNAVIGSFQLAAALEQTTVGFTTMLGSGEAAQSMLNDLRDFAAKTPFQFEDLTKAASRMIATGWRRATSHLPMPCAGCCPARTTPRRRSTSFACTREAPRRTLISSTTSLPSKDITARNSPTRCATASASPA